MDFFVIRRIKKLKLFDKLKGLEANFIRSQVFLNEILSFEIFKHRYLVISKYYKLLHISF